MFGTITVVMILVSPMGRQHRVELWGEYGVVVPSLWTTNGGVKFSARQIWHALNFESTDPPMGKYTVQDCILPEGSLASEEALRQALEDLYKLHNPQ